MGSIYIARNIFVVLASMAAACLWAQPVITSQPLNTPAVWGANASFSVMATGTGPLTYQWQLNGTNLPDNIISTLTGGAGFQGTMGTNTTLNFPAGTAVDATGNLYVADMNNRVVRKIGTNGVSTIVAGVGLSGFAGDGGPATNALLSQPVGVVCDTNGNLFIADASNNRVRKVDTNGIITTVAGNGSTTGSQTSGTATTVPLNFPDALAVDLAGNLYICDGNKQCIREVTPAGYLTTVAGMVGSAGYNGDGYSATTSELNYPSGVAVDRTGNIYIADTSNNRIRKVTTAHIMSTIAGTGTAGLSGNGGNATLAEVNDPIGVSVDAYTNIIIADSKNQCVREITNGVIQAVAGNGTAGFPGDGGTAITASLCLPQSATPDKAGNLYISDESGRIRKVGTDGIITTAAGQLLDDGDWATNSTLNLPAAVARDIAGNLYIADYFNYRIRRIDTNGMISTFAGNGIPGFAGDGGPATNANLYQPYGVAVDALGDVLISDQGNRRVRKVDVYGNISTIAGNGTTPFSGDGGVATNSGIYPGGLAADASGNVYIGDTLNLRVRKVDLNGVITTVAGNGSFTYPGDGGAATNAGISAPNSVTVDAIGNLYIAAAARALKVDTNGNIFTVAGNGTFGYSGDGGAATNAGFKQIFGIALDSAGNLFLSDNVAARIRKVGTNGIVNTIAGDGVLGFPVNNVPATGTSLDSPRGICLDNAGNLILTDGGINRLCKITYLDYADQASFMVTNVDASSLTNIYSVIVSNSSGSVTSSVASISLQLPPIIPAFVEANGIVNFAWGAVSNLTYQLQYTTNLAAPNWQSLGTPITATNNSASASDLSGADAQRFYRVQWLH